jgi:hypothetical protein
LVETATLTGFADSCAPQTLSLRRRRLAAAVCGGGENTAVDLARIGWLTTVVVLMITVLILTLQGYYGYAGVTLAVALSAAINLT